MSGPETNGNGNGTARRQLWLSVAIAVLALLGSILAGAWWIANLSFQVADVNHKLDNVSARLSAIEATEGDTRLRLVRLEEHQVEIETQLRASDIVRNLMHANDMRMQSVLWTKAGLPALPTDNAFYPSIATPETAAQH